MFFFKKHYRFCFYIYISDATQIVINEHWVVGIKVYFFLHEYSISFEKNFFYPMIYLGTVKNPIG